MNTEIELKFLVSPALVSRLPALLARHEICQHDQKTLANTYFDTPSLALGRMKAGLRIRNQNGKLEQTVKLAGSQVGGLHQRPEYNVDLAEPQPDLALFPAHIWPADFVLAQVQADLQPLFSTDFLRQRWVVKFNETEIELAFDTGEVRAGKEQDPIQELELELVNGEVADMFAFAELLLHEGGLRLYAVSKAQRGYCLAGLSAGPQLQALTLVAGTALLETVLPETEQDKRALLSRLAQGVEHWQHHEQGALSSTDQKDDWLGQVRIGVALVEQSLVSLNKKAPESAQVAWLEELTWLQAQLQTEKLSDELFYSPRYGRLLLQLTHYLYAEGGH
ncbi:hypothetical protein CBP31_05085 [Oceanisphaera profunda]|uniref:CYTH domain-containing protein n=1 Tax=Oceanisphaera profunda TaxID=1416627 RepID=A0A1Y0D3H0_9GAMM|nr:CYTH domain-containing protein [Oceanisphaera profunda]ART82073.1 hypothetical protein CBP31_05085 [Oceanisphaera profunda]